MMPKCVWRMFRHAVEDHPSENGNFQTKPVEELKAHMEKANVARDHHRACIAKAKK